jgi:branched-chain amino acid transport system ATP-binding protein
VTTLLEISGLTHRFGGLCAVSDFHLDLHEGELLGVIGPNGAGKTTLFNLVTGVYRASEGSVKFRGTEIVGMPPHEIVRLGVARTFQTIRLFKQLTVLDNVRVGDGAHAAYGAATALLHSPRYRREERIASERSMDLLERFQLADYAHTTAQHLPYGLQRRLELARALATKPKLLLLDEPAAGLNVGEVDRLMDLLRAVREEFKPTIVLIEHSMRLVMQLCERLKVLDFGTTIAEGDPDSVRSNPKVLEAYLGEESEAAASDTAQSEEPQSQSKAGR